MGDAGHPAQPVARAPDVLEAAADRFFDPLEVAVLDSPHEPQGLGLAPGGVRIDAKLHLRAESGADVVDQLDVAQRLEVARGQLDDLKPVLADRLLEVLRVGVEGDLVVAVHVGESGPGV